MSRPKASVPNQCAGEGGSKAALVSEASGS